MCLEIDLSRKAQPSNHGFPEGWKFAFESPRLGVENLQGLVLIPPPPSTTRYYSVERAMNHFRIKLGNVNEDL
jgi:hypothetical protein